MKNVKIDRNKISFLDMLLQKSNMLTSYTRNKVVAYIMSTKAYKEFLPIYSKLLNINFLKGQERLNLIN